MTEAVEQVAEELFQAEAPRLWRALLASTGVPEIADDALDEAFAQLLARGPAVVSPSRWVWKAAFRIAAGELKRRGDVAPLREVSTIEAPDEALSMIAALGQVPNRQRSALVLHYYAGYRVREIAEILGTSPATVRVQLTTGRRRLAQILERGDQDG